MPPLSAQMSQPPDAQTPAAPKKSRKKLFVAVGVFLLAGGGAGAYWTFASKPATAAEAEVDEEPAAPPAIVGLDPFVVNLADEGGGRYLRVTLGLVVNGEEHAKEFTEDAVARMRVRSSILEMLAQQTADHLTTTEGKAELKKAIAERASNGAAHLEVSDVLFSEFIVQ
jgi:flagellar protein FliL